jgi:hypothetical protein
VLLAYDYPLLGMLWTIIWIFLWVAWLVLLFHVFIDIFRSKDMGGWAKGLWSIFIILLPFLGVFVYVIARGAGMGQRDLEQATAREQQFQAYVRETAAGAGGGAASTADELAKMADLRDKGVISAEEFESAKAKILS